MPEEIITKRKAAADSEETNDLLKGILTLLSAQQGNSATHNTDKFNKLVEYLETEAIEKIEKKNREVTEIKEMARRNAENAAEGYRKHKFEQAVCRHRMPNQNPCISGQKLSNDQVSMVCLRCQKQWLDFVDDEGNRIAQDLIPDGIRLGLGTGF